MSVLVRIATTTHRVEVRAEPRDDVDIDGRATVVDLDGEIRIDASGALTVRVPEGTDVVAGSHSSRIEAKGRLGAVRVVSSSGRVSIDEADEVDARTDSSRVDIGEVTGHCRVRTESGRVDVTDCGSATISTRSGRIEIGRARGPVSAHCVSGGISIHLDRAADVTAETVSGRIEVRYPRGVRYRRDDRDPGATSPGTEVEAPTRDADCTVSATSVSGRVEVTAR